MPQDRTRLLFNVLLVLLSAALLWPGGEIIRQQLSGVTINHWPAFALWSVLIGPILLIGLFFIQAEYQVRREKASSKLAESGGSE